MSPADRDNLRLQISLAREALKDADTMALAGGATRRYKTLVEALDAAQTYASEAYRLARRAEREEETL